VQLEQLIQQSKPFLSYVLDWHNNLKPIQMDAVVANHPERVAVFAVDVTNGFCSEGPLASERVAEIVNPIVTLCQKAHDYGVRHFILPQDTHAPDAAEFDAYPPHCIAGTAEAETVDELKALPFADSFLVMEKNGLHAAIDTDLNPWLDQHPEVDTYIVTGDCTDLCTYQLAMHLLVRAHTRNLSARVLLPVNCVQTYHLAVDDAAAVGAIPHEGDLLHHIFLYHMRLNGIEVFAAIE
jgi:nicotinamidase-related amidase